MVSRSTVDMVRKTVVNNKYVDYYDKKVYPERYLKLMEEASKTYRNIRWLPLDVPKVEFDDYNEFLDIWDKECIDIVRLKPDAAEPWNKENHPMGQNSNYHKPQFKGLHFYSNISEEEFWKHEYGIWSKRLYQHPIFKKITEQILDTFPFWRIDGMLMWESVRTVYPHRDTTWFWNCPTEYRVMIHDENEQPTLYVADIEEGDINYIDIKGLDTNSFCWSNGSQIHGSDFANKRKQIICVNGIISHQKMVSLLDRSIEKYRNQLNYNLQI